MPDANHSARTTDGALDSVALLEALVRNDAVGAQLILDQCDQLPTIFCLASAWVALVEHQNLDAFELLESMRRSIHA